jgi:CRP/FNR family cyclic AMP-dependent transcriptional regulator
LRNAPKVDRRGLLSGLELFAQMTAAELDSLVTATSTRIYAAREVIFRAGDPGDEAFSIIHGSLKVIASGDDGQEAMLALMGPGETFGELAILDGRPRSATVTALESTLLLVIDRLRFHALLRSSPGLAYKTLLVTAARLRRLSERVEDVEFLGLPARLAKKLVELAERYGKGEPDGRVRIALRLSQRELGQLVGATRESVNKNLKLFAQHELLQIEKGHLVVRADRLRARATRPAPLDGEP